MNKIGIIGAGMWGSNHANALSNLNALCCIYDINFNIAKNTADRYNINALHNLDEMLESDVDGIVLATPAATHYQIAVKILKAGKGVLIEKPLAVNLNQALAIKNAMNNKSKLAIGYEERFNPAVISLIECLKHKEKISISLFRVGSRPERIKDVGVVLDTMIHDINIANYILGPLKVSGVWSEKDKDKREIFVTVMLEGNKGAAHLTASWMSREKIRMGIGVSTDAVVLSNFITQESECNIGGKKITNGGNKVNLLKEEDEAFIKYLNDEDKFPTCIDDAMADMDIALEILNKIGVSSN
ncbi:MAG: Gfo/Idh/MocA family oxidoreductase [Conexivisphaerales archaeon]